MSTTAHTIINSIPGIEAMSYLELGTSNGFTFSRVNAKTKVGVDVLAYPEPNPNDLHYQMTTDRFFAEINLPTAFDIIFIDACHAYQAVLNDYNNAIDHLSSNGLILIHDLIPPTKDHVNPNLCGDGFQLLLQIALSDQQFVSQDDDFGLTVINHPKKIFRPHTFTYENFENSLGRLIEPVTVKQMVKTIKEWKSK